ARLRLCERGFIDVTRVRRDRCAKVQAGSTTDDRRTTRELAQRSRCVLPRRERLVWIDEIEQSMVRAGTVCGAGLGRADVEAAIDLHGVTTQDRQLERLRQRDRQRALARGRRA